MSPWGMFEFIDMCNAMNITAVVTTFAEITPSDYANMVEYCWGKADTKYGALRISDGHPAPYNATWFELGNEQLNPDFAAQAAAMEARAAEIGLPERTLHYLYPSNCGGKEPCSHFPSNETAAAVDKLNIGSNAVFAMHCQKQDDPDCLQFAYDMLAKQEFASWSTLILETNLATHDVGRMLVEARAENMLLSDTKGKVHGRAASFCLERSGYNEGGLNDQGLIFFLPNATWLQPPGLVHKMYWDTWQPNGVAVITNSSASCPQAGVDFSAQASDDGKTVVLRLLNSNGEQSVNYTIDVHGGTSSSGGGGGGVGSSRDGGKASVGSNRIVVSSITSQTMHNPNLAASNTPSEPEAVVPGPLQSLGNSLPVAFSAPPNSVAVIVVVMRE